MTCDVLVAEIGSTTTLVNAFGGVDGPRPVFLGQGEALTTVREGDVWLGLERAIDELGRVLGTGRVEYGALLATSSAAGGLRMTVHGLVYDMTVKAAKEAALGAGAVLKMVTAGRLTDMDLDRLRSIRPNIILLAGGVDFGERETVLVNARLIADAHVAAPVIYAGNRAVRDEVRGILDGAGIAVTVVENVYPRVDVLNIEPARRAIQRVFEEHIVTAPGMGRVREMTRGGIMPTPGAVMAAARLIYETIGDLVVIDVGGATTDVHSVTEGSEEISRMLTSPEPLAKRTVEGDLGVFVNAGNIVDLAGRDRLAEDLGFDPAEGLDVLEPVPSTERGIRLARALATEAARIAVVRHAGEVRHLYGPLGRVTVAEGKDLTRVRWIIGTGGAAARLPEGESILEAVKGRRGDTRLLPPPDARCVVDRDYIMASCGVLGRLYPEAARTLMVRSLGLAG
ncbi:MAG: GlmL-related ornithine degradation protein [Bacillota bacterium]|nr:GlmL-related ornithine degradation protein [Bacillota bacterium]